MSPSSGCLRNWKLCSAVLFRDTTGSMTCITCNKWGCGLLGSWRHSTAVRRTWLLESELDSQVGSGRGWVLDAIIIISSLSDCFSLVYLKEHLSLFLPISLSLSYSLSRSLLFCFLCRMIIKTWSCHIGLIYIHQSLHASDCFYRISLQVIYGPGTRPPLPISLSPSRTHFLSVCLSLSAIVWSPGC